MILMDCVGDVHFFTYALWNAPEWMSVGKTSLSFYSHKKLTPYHVGFYDWMNPTLFPLYILL